MIYRCGATFSMPSSHAVTTMALALCVSMRHRAARWPLVAAAALISYSRVYLGVHYPFDVAVGWILGLIIAAAILALYPRFLKTYCDRVPWLRCDPILPRQTGS